LDNNNHWSCIKIGLQITQDLDEFLDEFSILYERMKCLCGWWGNFVGSSFFIVELWRVIKSCCEKKDIYL
jgi:hypothetical protein